MASISEVWEKWLADYFRLLFHYFNLFFWQKYWLKNEVYSYSYLQVCNKGILDDLKQNVEEKQDSEWGILVSTFFSETKVFDPTWHQGTSRNFFFWLWRSCISPQITALETMPLFSFLANFTLKVAGLVPAILPESWHLHDCHMILGVLWQMEGKEINARMNTQKRSKMD